MAHLGQMAGTAPAAAPETPADRPPVSQAIPTAAPPSEAPPVPRAAAVAPLPEVAAVVAPMAPAPAVEVAGIDYAGLDYSRWTPMQRFARALVGAVVGSVADAVRWKARRTCPPTAR